MEFVAVTLNGVEDLASAEIKSLLKVSSEKVADARLLFSAKSIEGFSPRLVNKLYSLITSFAFSSKSELVKNASKVKYSLKGSFVVRCSRSGIHDFDSRAVEREVGAVIFKQGFKVDLENPKNTVFVDIVGSKCFIGLLVKDNICKRPYRVRVFSSSINACLAASAIKFSGLKSSDVLLDPFCRDGVIPIEASLLGCKKVFAFDGSSNSVRNAKINAKLAAVKVKFSRCNVDSLDLKLDDGSVGKVVTCPPFVSKKKKQSSLEQVYKEFFHQLRQVLKKSGTITVISPKPELIELHAKRSGFILLKEKYVSVSNVGYKIVVFKNS